MDCNALARFDVQLLVAFFAGISSLLSIYLSYRSKREDRQRRWFYTQMLGAHNLKPDEFRRSKSEREEGGH